MLLAGRADAVPPLGPQTNRMWFYPDAPLDTTQVQDRRHMRATGCIYVSGNVYCTWTWRKH